jgi:hypothetical protein
MSLWPGEAHNPSSDTTPHCQGPPARHFTFLSWSRLRLGLTLYTACFLSHRHGPVQLALRHPLRSCRQSVQSTAPPELLHSQLEPARLATGPSDHSDSSDTAICPFYIPVVVYRCLLESAILQLSLHRESRRRDSEPLERTGAHKPSDPLGESPIRDNLSLRLLMEHVRPSFDPAAPFFSHNLDLLAQH